MFNSQSAMLLMAAALVASTHALAADAVEQRLSDYRAQGAGEFSASRGQALWTAIRGEGKANSCAACHTGDLIQPGKHVQTGKAIEPMAPSVNPARLGDAAKIEKWFLRNCKGSWGRECTPQEKGDFLLFIRAQ